MFRQVVSTLAVVASFAVTTYAGLPPTVQLKTDSSGVMTINVKYGLAILADIDDEDADIISVIVKLENEGGTVFEGPFAWVVNSLWTPLGGPVPVSEDLYTLTVAVTDAEGHETLATSGLQAHQPPVIHSVSISPETPTASEPVTVLVDVTDESELTGSASLAVYGSLHGEVSLPLSWNSSTERMEGVLSDLPAGGELSVHVKIEDAWSAVYGTYYGEATPAVLDLFHVTPSEGLPQSGDPVTVYGEGLKQDLDVGTLRVFFGEKEAIVLSTPSDESMVVVPPAALVPGLVPVTATLSKGGVPQSASLTSAFEYLRGPMIGAFDPRGASVGSGFEMRITGAGFQTGELVTVTIGGHAASHVELLSDSELRVEFAVGLTEDLLASSSDGLDLLVQVGTLPALAKDGFTLAEPRLNERHQIQLSAGAPARAVTFVGWLHSQVESGSFAIACPDAPVGERIRVMSSQGEAEPFFLDPWVYGDADSVGDLIGIESSESWVDYPGYYGDPEVLVGILRAPNYDDAESGQLYAFGTTSEYFNDYGVEEDELGFRMAALQDEDHDGVANSVAVSAPGIGRLHLVDADWSYLNIQTAFTSGEANDRLGESLAGLLTATGSFLAVGAPLSDQGGEEDAGSILLFERVEDPWPKLLLRDRFDQHVAHQNDGPFGRSMPLALLEVDGEERPIVIVGHPGYDGGRGRVEALHGETGAALWSMSGVDAGDGLGHAIVAVWDVNADGVCDLVVGAPGEDSDGQLDRGAAHVVSGLDGIEIDRMDGSAAGERFGSAVFFTGDTDSTFVPELLIATDSIAGPNALRRYELDPSCFTLLTDVGASYEGHLSDPFDIDGLTFDLAADEEVEIRVFAEQDWIDQVHASLLDANGEPLVLTRAYQHWDPAPDVKWIEDHWRLRYTATEKEIVHIVVNAPMTDHPRAYRIETERLAGGMDKWTVKKNLQSFDDSAVQFVLATFEGEEGYRFSGTIAELGVDVAWAGLFDSSGDEHPLTWGKDGFQCTSVSAYNLATGETYALRVKGVPPKKKKNWKKKPKLKMKLRLVKLMSGAHLTEWTQNGGAD